ncbi:hypothetical protein [Nitrosomonas sp.]|uniref:hypothetical protein n=1 Tax=Nitrosomonas sp. TaxID=42353 RepID=UPI0033066878
MGMGSEESTFGKLRISIWINILLTIVIVTLLTCLWKVHKIGIPANILVYDQRDMEVKNMESLVKQELDSAETEGVLVISRKDNGQLDSTLYSKNFSSNVTKNHLSFKELLLQIGSGSDNVYAGGDICYVFVYEGKVFRYCP